MYINEEKKKLILLQEQISIDNISIHHWILLIFIIFLGVLMIFSSYSVNHKILEINELILESNQLKSQETQIRIKLMKICLESELNEEESCSKNIENNSCSIVGNKKNDH